MLVPSTRRESVNLQSEAAKFQEEQEFYDLKNA